MPFIHFHSRPSGSTLAAANQSPAVAPCRSPCHPAPRDGLDSRHGLPHATSLSRGPRPAHRRLIPSHSPPGLGLPHAKTNNQDQLQPRTRIQNYSAKSRGLSLNRRSLNPARKVVTERTRRSNPRGTASCARPPPHVAVSSVPRPFSLPPPSPSRASATTCSRAR